MEKFHRVGEIDFSCVRWNHQLAAVVFKRHAYTPSFLAAKVPRFSIGCILVDHYQASKRPGYFLQTSFSLSPLPMNYVEVLGDTFPYLIHRCYMSLCCYVSFNVFPSFFVSPFMCFCVYFSIFIYLVFGWVRCFVDLYPLICLCATLFLC